MDVTRESVLFMTERSWIQYRLAKESRLSDGTVDDIFRRNAVHSTSMLETICRSLKITLSQFFAEGDTSEVTPGVERAP